MNSTRLLMLVSVLGFFLAGCSQDAEVSAPAEEAAPEEAAVMEIDPATAATLTGKVLFDGKAPRARKISMGAVPECAKLHDGKAVFTEQVVVNDNGTLRNVFVYVKGGLEGQSFAKPKEAANLDQKGCLYTPHVLGIQAGQELLIHTSDPTTHNIHPMPQKNREWNTSMPPNAKPLKRTFKRPEIMIPVKCNVHPWMRAYVGVLRHPFFAVSNEEGAFEITGLPPGEYVIEAWHEKHGTTEQKVVLGATETKSVEFTIQG